MASVGWDYWIEYIVRERYLNPYDIITKLPNDKLAFYKGDFIFDLMCTDYTNLNPDIDIIRNVLLSRIETIETLAFHGYMYNFFRFDTPNLDIFKALANEHEWIVKDSEGNTPLHYFAKPFDNHHPMYNSVITHERFPRGGLLARLCNMQNNEGDTPLHLFYKHCDFDSMFNIMHRYSKRPEGDCGTRLDLTLRAADGKSYQDLIGKVRLMLLQWTYDMLN